MKLLEKKKLAIFLFSILGVLATDSFAPLIQKVALSYPDVSEPMVKQLITLPSTIAMFVGLIAGQIVRFFKKKVVILVGLVLFSIGGIGAFWIPSFSIHIMLRSILGAGIGFVTPVNLSLIGDYFVGDERAGMIGNSLAFSKIFAIMVPPVAALLAAKNWQNVYFLYYISLFILIYAIFALDKQDKLSGNAESQKPKSKIPPVTIFLAIAQFVLLAIFFILVTDLSYLIETKNNNSTVMSGFGLSMATIGTTFAGLIFKRIYGKFNKWIVPVGLIMMGIGFLIVTHSMVTLVILMGLLFAGFGVGLLISVINLTTTNAVGDYDSTASMSLVTCASSMGVFVSPFLYSWNPANFPNLTSVQSDFQTAGLLYLFLGIISLSVILYQFLNKLWKLDRNKEPSLQGD